MTIGNRIVPSSQNHQAGFIWRPKWFLITRFVAVAGVAITLIGARHLFGIHALPYHALWMLTALLLATNVAYFFIYRYSPMCTSKDLDRTRRRLVAFTIVQINSDLVILTLMLHFSGGATNPFIMYFFFHTILASILLSKSAAYIEATVAAGLFSGMTVLEGAQVVNHYPLIPTGSYENPIFVSGMCFAMVSALIISVYMATSIMDRLRAYQADLEHALRETERLQLEKSRFLDVVAHDLKGPLASIETMVTSALAVYGDSIPDHIRRLMERIPIRTKELLRFIQELLDFSRISSADQLEKEFTTLNFLPIVSATVEMYMNQALDKNITITVNSQPDLPPVRGNRSQLQHLVGNLISNAITYTPAGGKVTVKVALDGTAILMTVADTGIGISEADLPRIFTDFYRAPNARKASSSGTGLGLSIVKTILEKHGGSVSVKSTEGEGSVFTVHLPAILQP